MIANTDSASTATSAQEGTPPLDPLLEKPDANSMAGADIQLPTFNGNGAEDSEQHWFLCEAVWMVRLVHNEDIRKAQMITNLRGCALEWFMKFCATSTEIPQKTLDKIPAAMISKCKKPKSEALCITEIKEIKQALTEPIWDFDQWFKTLIAKVSFQMSDVQHKEWFIASLLPHIRGPLMQQNIESQTKALELEMKLEASPIGDGAA